ncbi:MAG: DUF5689 domain-containing protein [Bacteroidetes bacterium]|jgi:hypothetical protein|nr:DUF5689 domain-containing protein [Bacteroidota bacterium]
MRQKLRLMAVMAMMFMFVSTQGQIISQYVETNSGTTPKGIEIWNNTGATLDFATNNLVIEKGSNGGAPSQDYLLDAGTLADGEVIVIGTTDMQAVTEGNGATYFEKAFTFNGDDALVVKYGGTITDVLGTPGSDPGSSWSGNGVSTANQNIQLLNGITSGDTDGWTDPSERFETVSTDPVNDITGFGIAPIAGGNIPPFITNIAQSPSAGITSSTTISVSADVTDSDGTLNTVELKWGTTSGDYSGGTISMTNGGSGDTFTTTTDLPAQADGTTVYYVIEATDDEPATTTSAEQSYAVTDPATTSLPYTETFDTDLGDVYTISVSGDTKFWQWDDYSSNGFAVMNGYNSGDLEEDWLILPGIDMNAYGNVTMEFTSAYNYGSDDATNYLKLYYSTDYAGIGDPSSANWTELSFTQPSTGNYTWTNSGIIDLSTLTGNVWLGFKYHYSAGNYRTWEIDDVSIQELASPIISVNPTTLSGFTYMEGSGPSASQSFTVEGVNLTSDITVTPPANYEISTDDVSFQSTAITLTQTAGSVATTTLYTRLEAGLSAGDYNGQQIIAAATDAVDQTVTLDGTVSVFFDGFIEDFTNSNATGSYADNTFTGNYGIDWTYIASRDGNGDANNSGINLPALMLRQASSNSSITSETISGGIGSFSVKLYKGFTGGGDRQVELFINGISQGTSTPFDDYDEHIFEVNDINIGGDFTIQITNITAKQVIIDDITWTSFDGPANIPPVIANITQTPATDIMDDQTVSVSADVTDSDGTIASVILNWGTTSGNLSNSIPMSVSSGDTYTTDTDIPAQDGGTSVYYAITATDDLAAETTSAEQSYTVVLLDPALVLTPDALSGFEYELGEGPSTSQSYTVSGFNFVGSGLVDVTAPASFEISIDNSDWFNSLVLQYADGELIAQPRTIYVRMKSGLTAGEKDEAISHQDVNIGLVELPVSGEVTSVTQVADIATLRQGATDGTVYQLTGEAILTFAGSSRNQKFIQDGTAGILIDDAAGNLNTAYEIGDGITGLTGTLSVYQNMVQFVPQTDAGAPTSTGNTITPVEVTLDALDATYQAQLVKVNFVDFNTTGNFTQGSNYTITDPSGNGVMRTQYSNLDYIGTPIPETTQNLTGVIMQFSSTMQLIPRSLEDFEDAPITDPTIFADPMVINGLSYPVGGGPSNAQSFMISGVNLTSGISVTTSSAYFDISPTGGSNFVPTSPIILNHTNGVVEETPIYVRLKAGLDLGNYNGEEIVANASGAENAVITLNGTVYDGSGGGGGLETFANLDLEGSSYADGSFLGQDGSTWTYFQSRGDVEITEKAIMLGRNRTPQANVYSGTIFGGIGTLNFDYLQAFSSDVNLNVLVNDVVVGNVTSDGEQNVIKNSGTITVNVDGPVVIKFISANNGDGQVVIDNVAWTAYEGGLPVAAAPSFDPPAGSYADPIDITLSSATANADIFFSQSSENGPWTAYSAPIAVDEATTIWAYATADDYEDSPVVSAAYTFTDVVSVATIAELRAGATDGTVYQLTGEAILTFQTSTRNQKFIQDATGAILIDDNSGAITTSYNLYDGITGISGTLSTYSNMLQFVPETDPGAASSTGNTVTPVEVSLDELDNTYQAQLVTVNFADFEATGNFASGQNYTITDPSGSGVMRTQYSDLDYIGEPIPTTTQNITGVILQFSSTMQLVPRSLADFEEANITDPFIAVSPATLNGFSYEIGNGPSAEQNFVVSALNLTTDLSLDAPANYEISLGTGGSFVATDPVLLTPTAGTIDATTIYVRLKAGLDVGTYGEQVLATSAGATDKTVTLNGNVSDPSAGGGFETFANLDYDGNSYVDGTFLGQDGSTWTYVQARGDLQITDESITLGRNRDPQSNVYSGLLDGGIGVINFDYMQAFSTDVNLNIMVNDVVVGTVTSTGEQNIVKNSGDIVVNVPGQVVIKFMNVNNSDGQVTIDNVSWTAYDGGTPVVLAPTFNPPAGNYFDPIDVTISSATSGATVFYSTESATGPWTEFTAPVNVSEETTIWAYGELDGYTNSAVSSANYTFGDVVQVATIAELRLGATDGTVYQLTGEAILTFQSSERNQKFIQDATAGILIDDNSGNITTTYDIYDGITGITGTLTTYAEMLQFVPQSDPGAATSTGNTVDPLLVSLSDLDNTYQAQLVTVNMVDFLTDGQFEDGVNYDITDPSGDGIFRTHYGDVDYIGTDIPVELQNITGVILQFNDDMQLVARNLDDFEDANITDPYLTVNPATINGFSYFVGEGPSASQSYQLSGQNLEGSGNITVAAPENYEISNDDNSFVTSLDFPIADGVITGQPITVYVRMKADLEVGLYEGETIAHTGGNAPEVLVTLNGEVTGEVVPAISYEIVPQYIQGINGTNNNRLPYAYWVTLSNLTADATYRYINQAVVAGDDATTNGAGNVIFTNLSGDFYRSTSPSFSTDGSYGLFSTDSDGSYSGWFITEATANSRFTPGNEVFMRIRLNDGNDGTATETYLTTTNGATVINFGTENDPTQGTAIRAISGDLPKSFALLYDNNREGQPIAATSIETTGIDFAGISQYATFYKDEVAGNDGHWGTIIPNANENGIQLIEIRDLVDGAVLKTYQAADGVWGTTNTVNPVGGMDEILVIDLIEIGLADNLAAILKVYATQQQFVIEKASTEKLRLDVYNLMGQPMMQTELNGIGTQKLSHHLSSGVYILHLNTESGLKQAVKVIIR